MSLAHYVSNPHESPRFKTPCNKHYKLEKDHNHILTYRDPDDATQGTIRINSFLGLDGRGHKALSTFKNYVIGKNINQQGQKIGTGLLGNNIKYRNIELSMQNPPKDKLEEEQEEAEFGTSQISFAPASR